MRKVLLIVAAICLVGLTTAAFAEVQNVKVSGDISVMAIGRNNFDLGVDGGGVDAENYFMSTTRLRVDADLTDNVSTTVRLINERDWNVEAADGSDDTTDIDLDLAYVTLKEMLYSPLTITLGRQELMFGNGMIVGDPDTNRTSVPLQLQGRDLSARKAFDAIKATLDYKPLMIDMVYAKVNEKIKKGTVITDEDDDVDLYGINAGYDIGDKYNSMAEAYFFAKVDQATSGSNRPNKIYCPGLRLSTNPVDKLNLQGEIAWQRGEITTGAASVNRSRDAMAAQVMATLGLPIAEKYSPMVGVVYSYFSGDKNPGTGSIAGDDYKAWDPMFENQTAGHIMNVLFDSTDSRVLTLKGSLQPIEDVTLAMDVTMLWLAKKLSAGAIGLYQTAGSSNTIALANMSTDKTYLGTEYDVNLTYDYTEDVKLGLLFGLFDPGAAFSSDNRRTATELIGSCKVLF